MRQVEIIEAARSRSLVTLGEVKAHLGINTDELDERLERLILDAGELIAGAEGLDRFPWRQRYRQRLAGDGGIYLHLAQWPIEKVHELKVRGQVEDAGTYSVALVDRSVIYRETRWAYTEPSSQHTPTGTGHRAVPYEANYTAGWVMPDQVSTWQADTEYGEGLFVRATDPTRILRFQADGGGTSGGTEPEWPSEEDATVVDNDITWTARMATELPGDLRRAALLMVDELHRGAIELQTRVRGESFEGMRIDYRARDTALSDAVMQIVRGHR